MKLKYRFVIREMAEQYVAVAVGADNAHFHGMVKLNSTGAFLMERLNEKPCTEEELLHAMLDRYDVTRERARENLQSFLQILRDGDLLI